MKKYILFILVLTLYSSIITSPTCSQWIKQNWPVFESVYGVSFFDANTGLVAGKTFPENHQILYRSTNSGYNWSICIWPCRIGSLQKIDSITGFMWALDWTVNGGNNLFFWTSNKGLTWDSVNYGHTAFMGMTFISRDTGWAAIFDGNFMRYFFTSNGGISFVLLYSQFSSSYQPKMFFLREKYNGNYIGYRSELSAVKKTTDGGYNWIDLPALPVVQDFIKNEIFPTPPDVKQITFINKDTGWVTNGTKNIFKTTNGGLNWISQHIPGEPHLNNSFSNFYNFKIINKDTIYADAGSYSYSSSKYRGVLFKTTNGGNNWGYQMPDTSYGEFSYGIGDFINNQTGWATYLHTTNGGGPIIYTEVKNISVNNPTKFNLCQNYPNPFNPSTTIDFYLPISSEVYLRIIDVTGRLIYRVIEGFHLAQGYHSYKVDDFTSLELSSGIYFYQLITFDHIRNQMFKQTKKVTYKK